MDLYYICEFSAMSENHDLFMEFHFVYLDEQKRHSDKVFLCARFRHKADEANWRQKPGVEPLPHPLSDEKISVDHALLLRHHGVLPGHRTVDAAEQAAKLHCLMRFSVL